MDRPWLHELVNRTLSEPKRLFELNSSSDCSLNSSYSWEKFERHDCFDSIEKDPLSPLVLNLLPDKRIAPKQSPADVLKEKPVQASTLMKKASDLTSTASCLSEILLQGYSEDCKVDGAENQEEQDPHVTGDDECTENQVFKRSAKKPAMPKELLATTWEDIRDDPKNPFRKAFAEVRE
jgi:hypothetical protein